MNVFALSPSPIISAALHCDKHSRKMIVESAQILSTVLNVKFGIVSDKIYKKTHQNHPCTIWASESSFNFKYILDLAMHLCYLYHDRSNKIHKTFYVLVEIGKLFDSLDSWGVYSSPRQAMPDEYKHENSYVAYLNYYIKDKSRLFNGNDVGLLFRLERELEKYSGVYYE